MPLALLVNLIILLLFNTSIDTLLKHTDKSSVLAAVYGPKEVKIKDEKLDRAFIEVIFKPLVGLSGIYIMLLFFLIQILMVLITCVL